MKHPDHLAFTLLLSLCTLGFLPAAAQDLAQIVRKTRGGLRRVYTEIEKLKMTAE